METNQTTTVIFHIYGGHNQILPNATEAVQKIYGAELSHDMSHSAEKTPSELSPDEMRLAIYINKEEQLKGYITLLASCRTAKEVGEVVATMCQNEEGIDSVLIAKAGFIKLLLPFLKNVESGRGIDNLRTYINNAWETRRKALRQSSR